LTKTRSKSVVQVQEPAFCNSQVFVKLVPGENFVPSGMVTSFTNFIARQGRAVGEGVLVGGNGVMLGTGVEVRVGVLVTEGVSVGG
jgi:hypothetical protein